MRCCIIHHRNPRQLPLYLCSCPVSARNAEICHQSSGYDETREALCIPRWTYHLNAGQYFVFIILFPSNICFDCPYHSLFEVDFLYEPPINVIFSAFILVDFSEYVGKLIQPSACGSMKIGRHTGQDFFSRLFHPKSLW